MWTSLCLFAQIVHRCHRENHLQNDENPVAQIDAVGFQADSSYDVEPVLLAAFFGDDSCGNEEKSCGADEFEECGHALVLKAPDSAEDHGHSEFVGFGDDFGVTDGAAGLDDGVNAGGVRFFYGVREGEERVGRHD